MDVWDYGDNGDNSPDDYWDDDHDEGEGGMGKLDGWDTTGSLTSPSNMKRIWEFCVIPVIQQSFIRLLPIICFTVLTGELLQRWVSGKAASVVCVISGAMIISSLVNVPERVLFILLMISSYGCILIAAKYRTGKVYISVLLIGLSYLVFREHVQVFEPGGWAEVRGIVMIAFMKVLSLVFELTHEERLDPPSPTDYFGYIFFPGSIAFGPWVTYSQHSSLLGRFGYRTDYYEWFIVSVCKMVYASIHLMFSTCIIHFYFIQASSRFLLLFRDAATVRFSHYFICRLSEALYFMSGPRSSEDDLKIPVARELRIEFPRSLVDVVVNWNLPMHRWFKKHVYIPSLATMGKTKAGLVTFLVSAMLHGLNFRLSAVLLSLAVFCYVEYSFRRTFADFISGCVEAYPCNRCNHKYRNDLLIQVFNFAFFMLALFNLAYLGVMLDTDSDEAAMNLDWISSIRHQVVRWTEFNFFGHVIMLALLIFRFILEQLLRAYPNPVVRRRRED